MAYRSKYEKIIAASLNSKGVGFTHEPHVLPFTKAQRLTKVHRQSHGLSKDFVNITYHIYLPDFLVKNGIYIEAKGGTFKRESRTTLIGVKKCNPNLRFIIAFRYDRPIYPGSKTKNSQWAIKNDFEYFIGTSVPDYICK